MNKIYFKKTLITASAILLWLVIWEISAPIIDPYGIFFTGAINTFSSFFTLALTIGFWKTVFFSIVRILLGFILGVALGILLSILSHKFVYVNTFVSMGMSVIKATPVASIIMIIWVIAGEDFLPIAIATLMVSPIIWQNLIDAYDSIDKNLVEVAEVFELSRKKKFKLLVFPALLKYFIPAAITSIGLAWKSGIAAEIISFTAHSIGKNIFNAKQTYEPEVMLAWTLTVIVISIAFEKLIKHLIRRFKSDGN